MIKSMTGYGRGVASSPAGDITVEIKSVNHRFRDTALRLPSKIAFLEVKTRKAIEAVVTRGRVEISITFSEREGEEVLFDVDIPLARGYISAVNRLKKELNLKGSITLTDITETKDIIRLKESPPDEDQMWETVRHPIFDALKSLDKMRSGEGKNLALDINMRLSRVTDIAEGVLNRQPETVKLRRDRLMQRVATLAGDVAVDESRLAQEVAILADRSDITEEVIRLKSHIGQFDELINTKEAVGRKLDFLTQEMNREINTIGSKSCDTETSRDVVNMKAELEKIREQVQNVE